MRAGSPDPIQQLIRCGVALAAIVLGSCARRGGTPPAGTLPTTSPVTPAGENWAGEQSRVVYEDDLIVSILKNGMTVIVKRVPSPVLAVRAHVRTGSLYEGEFLGAGVSHLLEHLVAGGTNARRSEADNRNLLQRIGNDSNAYTSFDQTVYFVNTTPNHLDEAVDLVGRWVLHASITADEFEREREVVQRELEKNLGEADWVWANLTQLSRYQVSPARLPIIGYKSTIQGLSRDDVYKYYRRAYSPDNMVFAVAGDADPEAMLEAVQRYVGDSAPTRAFVRQIPAEPTVTAPRTMVGTFPGLGQAKLELAFPSFTLLHEDLYALDLLAAILGQGESSILVTEIRDRQRLASSVAAWNYTPSWGDGTFTISTELDADQIEPATKAVLAQIATIREKGVTEAQLQRAKTQVRAARAFATQTSEQIAASLADDWISTGDVHFSDRYAQRMQEVSAEQVLAMARKYLDAGRLLTTAMLAEEGSGDGVQGSANSGAATRPALAAATDLLRAATPTTHRAAAADASAVERIPLDNGILLLKRIPTSPVVAVRMYALGGLTAEDAAANGLGKLAMSTVSRGSKTRSAEQIAEFFDSVGAQFEADCGNNTWSWTASCLNSDLPKVMEVFGEIVRQPAFEEDQVARMRQRLAAAIDSQDNDWFSQAFRFFRMQYFGPRQSPYQFLPIGTKKNVSGFSADQVRDWYATKVLKAPRVLAIYGDIDVDAAKALAAAQFGAVARKTPGAASAAGQTATSRPAAEAAATVAPAAIPAIDVTRVEVQKTANPVAGVIIGFDANLLAGDPANYPLTIGDTMATGFTSPTGYVFETLRGMGLVYDAQGFSFNGVSAANPGTFIVYAGCDPKDVDEVLSIILLNIARLQGSDKDMQADWFERARTLAVTAEAMGNQTAADQAQTAALDELMGLGYNFRERFADNVGAVNLSAVRAVAKARLNRCVVTVSTPRPELVKLQAGQRRYPSFPAVDLTPRGVRHAEAGGK